MLPDNAPETPLLRLILLADASGVWLAGIQSLPATGLGATQDEAAASLVSALEEWPDQRDVGARLSSLSAAELRRTLESAPRVIVEADVAVDALCSYLEGLGRPRRSEAAFAMQRFSFLKRGGDVEVRAGDGPVSLDRASLWEAVQGVFVEFCPATRAGGVRSAG